MHACLPPGSVVALSDAAAGNHRQAVALAERLDPQCRVIRLEPEWPARWWAPRRFPGAPRALGEPFMHLLASPPALAVGCGRQAALATRLLRQACSRVVQILDPRVDRRHWDWVVIPRHDGVQGSNVLTLDGSLNPVDDLWLAQARSDFPALGALPAPRVALLVGGPTRHWSVDDAQFIRQLDDVVKAVAEGGGTLLASASRRTPAGWCAALHASRAQVVWCSDADGPNPYRGLLGWADVVVCTADSVNMLSEACASMAPVYVLAGDRLHGRLRRFLDTLTASRRVRAFDGALEPFAVQPLRETERVAARLGTLLADAAVGVDSASR